MDKHREYGVMRGRDGFNLWVRDYGFWRYWLGEIAYRVVGPLDRGQFVFIYRVVNAVIQWQHNGSVVVFELPLTSEHAKTLCPHLKCETWLDAEDEDELDHMCNLLLCHEGEHLDSDTGQRWT